VAHTPGSLADVLTVFKQNKINLTWIESFPVRDVKGEYVFFTDFDGHHEDPRVKKAIKGLEEVCDSVSVLGSFPVAKVADE
jgi:chorismate mutase/prephenate dehydratase